MESKIDIILSNGDKAGETLKELTKQANLLNKEIKDLKPGTGAFADKAKDLDAVNSKIGGIKDQIKGTTQASDALKDSVTQNIPLFGQFGKVGQTFTSLKSGVGGLTSSFGLLGGAIAATGIGLLVIAFATLVGWFQKTDEGATLLSGIMRGFGIIMDTVFGKLIDIFKGLGDYFNGKKSIKQGLIDLVDFIGTNLLNRVKSFLVIWEGIKNLDLKKATDGLIQMTTGVTDATDKMIKFGKAVADAEEEGVNFEKTLDAIEDKARDLSVLNANTEKEVSRLILQSKNVGLTYQQRIDLLDKASSLELKNHKEQLANAIALEQFRKKEIADNKARNIQNDELDQQLADATIARTNLEKESLNLQEKIDNRRTALTEKQLAEQQKAEEANQKAREKSWEEYYNNLHDLENKNVQTMADGREKDLSQLKLTLQREIEALDVNAPLYAERLAATQELARQKRNEINTKWDKKDLADKTAAIDLQTAAELNKLNEDHLAGILSQSQYVEQSQQLAITGEKAKLDIIKSAFGENSKEYQDGYGKLLDLQKSANDSFVKNSETLSQNLAKSVSGTLNVFANLFGSLAGLFDQGTQQYKAFATAQAIISTIQGSVNAYTSALSIPYIGEVLAPIAAAAALAAGYAQVRKIQNTDISSPVSSSSSSSSLPSGIKKAEQGMVLSGPSHAQGGIPIEAEGDEIILTKGVYRNPHLRSFASALNVAGGGRKFAAGGPINPFNNNNRSSSINGGNESSMKDYIDQVVTAINSRIDRLKVFNVMTAPDKSGYKDKLDLLNQITSNSDV